MTFDAIALPSLDGIPASYMLRDEGDFARPLALSLLNNELIGAEDIVRRPASENALCSKALTRHWREIIARLTLFDWQLSIEQDQYANGEYWASNRFADKDQVWALIRTENGPFSCQQVCVGPAMEWLEGLRRGFGQTVLAALYDVLYALPLVCTTRTSILIAESTYWCGYDTEKDAAQELMMMNDVHTMDDLRTTCNFVTRKEIYGSMPRWARAPRRVLSRRQIERVAHADGYARRVVDAMDELWTVLKFCGPFPDFSSKDTEAELIDFTLLVRWTEGDSAGRILDDYGHYVCDGDYVNAASVTGLHLSDRTIPDWLQQMRSVALLAAAAERVLTLLGSRAFEAQQTLIRVLV
jgi:PRTRC genetic system protein F